MNEKKTLRNELKVRRKFDNPESKAFADGKIVSVFLASEQYHESSSLLIYVSVGDEIDTYGIISRVFADNKSVAVPYCKGKTMEFYEIASLNELIPGAYGIPSVDTENKEPFIPNDGTLCIVPALAFDRSGGRIGYGGGFYDRYLSRYSVSTLGLCYEKCLLESIPLEEHDVRIDCIITENELIKTRR